MKSIVTVSEIVSSLNEKDYKRGWKKGVRDFAIDLISGCGLKEIDRANSDWLRNLRKRLLNGAENWKEYSYGGCYLIYDYDICEALCTEKGVERYRDGERQPNRYETWLDVQARALSAAFRLITSTIKKIK